MWDSNCLQHVWFIHKQKYDYVGYVIHSLLMSVSLADELTLKGQTWEEMAIESWSIQCCTLL
jgi:hypothetical protein